MISYRNDINYEELSKPQLAIGNYYLNDVRRMKPPKTDNFDAGYFPRARGLRNQAEDMVDVEARLRGQGAPPSRQDYSFIPKTESIPKATEKDIKPEEVEYPVWQADAEFAGKWVRTGGRTHDYLRRPYRFEDHLHILQQDASNIIIEEPQRGGLHTRNVLKDRHIRNHQ